MADEKQSKAAAAADKAVATSTAATTESAVAALPDAGTPGKMIPKEKYDEVLQRMKSFEDTLRAMQGASQQQPQRANQAAQQMQGIAQDAAAVIAQRLGGADPEQVRQWVPFLSAAFEEIAKPYINVVAAIADKVHGIEARSSIKDYDKFSTEIDQERQTRLGRGEYLPHDQAYHLVRSRHLPEILEEERKKALEELQDRQTEAAQITASDTVESQQKAGPSATKSNQPLSRADFEALPLEEKERYLENLTF